MFVYKLFLLIITIKLYVNVPENYFCWQKGVIIAGNLEKLEKWATDNKYTDEWGGFMGKTTAITELLSTPKNHLVRVSWILLCFSQPVF